MLIAAGLLPACSGVGYYQPVAVDHHVHAMNTVDHVCTIPKFCEDIRPLSVSFPKMDPFQINVPAVKIIDLKVLPPSNSIHKVVLYKPQVC